jgi:hypothetical protein
MKLTIDNVIKYVLLLIITVVCIYTILYIYYIKHHDNISCNKEKTNTNPNHTIVKNKEPEILMYYCSKYKLNEPTKTALDDLNIGITNDISETQLYFPCGFNKVEVELNKLRFINDIPLVEPEDNEINTLKQHQEFKNKVILGIPGCDKLCSKNAIWGFLKQEYGITQAGQIMPMSFIISDQRDMLMLNDIEQEPHSQLQSHKNVYILKNNNQGKKGLYMTNNVSRLINDDKKTIKEYKVIQKYITNPYLINKRKLNIRLYVLIYNIRDSETQWYLYNSGKCIYNNKDYDPTSSLLEHNLQDKEQHFTSLNLDTDYIYSTLGNPETLDDLKQHFGDENYNYVMYKIINKLRNIKMVYNKNGILRNQDNLENNTTIQYFGIDIILNDELEPYILEFNKGPEMKYKSPHDKELKNELLNKVFTISKGLYNQHYRMVDNVLTKCFTVI